MVQDCRESVCFKNNLSLLNAGSRLKSYKEFPRSCVSCWFTAKNQSFRLRVAGISVSFT